MSHKSATPQHEADIPQPQAENPQLKVEPEPEASNTEAEILMELSSKLAKRLKHSYQNRTDNRLVQAIGSLD
ncbi:hypothetical protein PIB30_092392 [Stylosanthes scabra]|uniref:Uncharacterized protein n=1 Tax=Stylosanthes scabra TaxID=79078 RepID=A0ABU6VVY3_9FABA|nr:hypothetical protein [Stylosanthes scabra]